MRKFLLIFNLNEKFRETIWTQSILSGVIRIPNYEPIWLFFLGAQLLVAHIKPAMALERQQKLMNIRSK